MSGFEIPKLNMFNQMPVQQTAPVGPRSTQPLGGTERSGGAFGTSGGSAVDRELADMRRFIPAYNGTGELRPNNAESGARLQMLYA